MTPAWSKLPRGPRTSCTSRGSVAILGIVLCAMSPCAGAQDLSKHYFHVRDVTTGCQNPAAVRLLTNPDETSQADARRLRSIRSSGHCVTITPRSQWSFLWRENDVAMMSYAGTVGRPGSYYLRVEDMVDAEGHHPGELDADAYPAANGLGTTPDAASLPPGNSPAKPAEVPTIIPQAAASQVASAPIPGKSIDDLIAKTNAPPFTPQPAEDKPADGGELSSHIWVPAISLALFVAALGGFAALRRRQGRSEKYEPALAIALDEVQAQALALREAKADSARPDRYGTWYSDRWDREKAAFIGSRISPRLRDAGYEDMLPALLPAIDTEIERHADALVEPPQAGGEGRINGTAVEAVDAALSDYAVRCTSMLRNAGWTTDPNPAVYGKAVDIFAERGGRKLLLQCKGGEAPVGVEAVQQVFTLKDRRHADIAAIITQAPFTRAAQQMASANGVHALHDEDLMELIQ